MSESESPKREPLWISISQLSQYLHACIWNIYRNTMYMACVASTKFISLSLHEVLGKCYVLSDFMAWHLAKWFFVVVFLLHFYSLTKHFTALTKLQTNLVKTNIANDCRITFVYISVLNDNKFLIHLLLKWKELWEKEKKNVCMRESVRACVSESTNIRYTMSVKLIDLRSTHKHTHTHISCCTHRIFKHQNDSLRFVRCVSIFARVDVFVTFYFAYICIHTL